MKKFLAAAAAMVVLGWAGTAGAATITISQSGTINGLPVSATAQITGNDGESSLTLVLTNTSTGHTSVAQALVGFLFFIDPAAVTITGITSQSGRAIRFNNSETATDVGGTAAADLLGWGLNATLGTTALGFTGPNGTNPPDEAILGPPTSGLTYTGANPSITNSGPHQPFVMQTATFVLALSGPLTAGWNVVNPAFFFNTDGTRLTPGGGGPGPGTVVPEPASMMLLGSGLAAMAAGLRRRRSK